ncbi:condensation domain-containing protein [Streptomyces sp. DSM 42041]|uniref:Condensation domain-containing protein n=1 Tax=Streptomyces hazeniae TaxID=3075538 RepID=A0ABU2NKL5_9ACTN|nr:condensation domain-containing protein [Streptomyces sp. DSM 42041]MDT0377535.1 condensation domain-containing protein [Streptomyces sp. DSM 42041]
MSGTSATRGRPGIAVIGISARFPQADGITRFRANLRAGRDSVRPMPQERREATCLDPDAVYPQMGYLDRIDLFDHAYFGLSRREAEVTDPQHRIALQLTREALENAGYAASRMRDSRTAVVFSSPSNGYLPLVREVGTLSMIGNIPCGLPARVSHLFGFTGPCYGVDTGCNGSLVAVHQASRELRDGDADYAVVGGVSVRHVIAPEAAVAAFPGIASPTARCRAFDEKADGAGAGEGGAVLLLTTVDRALREGAFIHAVIRGTAVVHNGRHSATIATPSARSQAEAIRRAWQHAGADIGTAGYLETHGSGTRLGDAVEVEGLALARTGVPEGAGDLPVGSVKTNLGHLDHAAGIAGLVKTVLSVRHGELYPSLHFDRPAEDVDLRAARLEVVTDTRSWQADVRRAGVSSFSLGGINAHCVVEQPPAATGAGGPSRPSRADRARRLVGVSARTADDLVLLCERLSLVLRDENPPLDDVARTLNEGRDHHPHRRSVVAGTTAELATQLAAHALWTRLDATEDEGAPGDGREPGSGTGGRADGSGSSAPPRVVLLLSGDATGLPDGPGGALPDGLPLPPGPAERVRGQLAAHAALTAAGVRPAGLMSSGVSRYAARHLQGRLTAEDTAALRRARDTGSGDGSGESGDAFGGPVRPERLRAAVEEQLAAGPVVFVEPAAHGEISDLLRDQLAGRTDARVVRLGADAEDVLGVLGHLYESGVDIDWSALRPDAADERPGPGLVPLPGHPFRGVRCWARQEGDVIRFGPPAEPTPAASTPAEAVPPPPPAAPVAGRTVSVLAPASASPGREPADLRSAETVPEPARTAAAPEAQAEPQAEPEPQPEAGSAVPGRAAETGATVLPWLREAMAALLYAEDVAADADYFSIGGNSVIALQLVERVISRYAVALRLVDIYTHPVVSDLADAIAARLPEPSGAAVEPAAPGGRTTASPATDADGLHRLPPIRPGQEPTLSYGQERMWFHHQLDPDTRLYNLPGATRMRGELDLEAMRLAWEDLARRHEVLRSNFVESDGRPGLAIRPELGDFFHVLDVSAEPDPEAAARAAVRDETDWVFDVAHDPLVRVAVVRIAPGDHLFCWTMHHGVNDGWAPQILMGELIQFYEARCQGREHRPEPLPVQYRDYARWQRDLLEGALLDGELDYWRRKLADPPALELATDRPRPARMDYAGATYGFTVPAELVRRLRAVGSRETATLFMVLLTGLKVLLSRWSGQRDVVVGTPTIGRSRPELWGLLGFFNNTIALRSDLSGDVTFRELLRRVRTVVLEAMEHQEIPFDRVVREVAPDRDPSRNPIFDVMYVHQTLPPDFALGEKTTFNPGRPGGGDDETPQFPGLPAGTAKFDLTVVMAERPDHEELEVAVEYSTRLFDGDTVAAMAQSLLDLLWAAAENEDTGYDRLPAGPPDRRPAAVGDRPAPAAARPERASRPVSAPDDHAVTSCLELCGVVDEDALRAAFDDLTERHEVLRTRLPASPAQEQREQQEQQEQPAAPRGGEGRFRTLDVSHRPRPAAAARELARTHGSTATDPDTGAPARALLATTGPDSRLLVVTTHRDAYDGAQPGLLFGDLLALYAARCGREPAPPAPPVSYGDYARWQRDLRADGLLDGQLAHWRGALAGLPSGGLPTDRPRPTSGTHACATHTVRVPSDLAHALARAGTRERLLAGIAAITAWRSGTHETVVGLAEAAPDTDSTAEDPDRPRPGEAVGPFANPLALRISTADDPGLETLSRRVRAVVEEASAHADVPFEDVVHALRPPREPGRPPLFDLTYAHHRLPRDLGAAAGLEVRPGAGDGRLLLPAATAGHDLAWSVLEGPEPGALTVSVTYRTELFDEETVVAAAADLTALLRRGCGEPEVPLSALWLADDTAFAD